MINFVIPKGSLENQTLKLLSLADLTVERSDDREYDAEIDDPRIGGVKILRPQEIPEYVQDGYFDLGITGQDWILETGADVVGVADLPYTKRGFGKIRIVLAVSEKSKINSTQQIKTGIKISTEYPNLTRQYFRKLGKSVKIYPSYGATEAKVPDIVDAIVDLTETGATLRRHGMKVIDTILETSTKLIANKKSYKNPKKREAIEEIKTLLLGAISAQGRVLIKFNISEEKLKRIIKILPALKAPTISKLFDGNYCAIETVVEKSQINLLIPKLKKFGAEDIIEIPLSKIVR